VLPPPPLGHPPVAITPEKVEKILFKKEGVKGMLPACCLPLWGRERVALIAAADNYQMTLKKRVSTEPIFFKKSCRTTARHMHGARMPECGNLVYGT
jgi:hypothetical protein